MSAGTIKVYRLHWFDPSNDRTRFAWAATWPEVLALKRSIVAPYKRRVGRPIVTVDPLRVPTEPVALVNWLQAYAT